METRRNQLQDDLRGITNDQQLVYQRETTSGKWYMTDRSDKESRIGRVMKNKQILLYRLLTKPQQLLAGGLWELMIV